MRTLILLLVLLSASVRSKAQEPRDRVINILAEYAQIERFSATISSSELNLNSGEKRQEQKISIWKDKNRLFVKTEDSETLINDKFMASAFTDSEIIALTMVRPDDLRKINRRRAFISDSVLKADYKFTKYRELSDRSVYEFERKNKKGERIRISTTKKDGLLSVDMDVSIPPEGEIVRYRTEIIKWDDTPNFSEDLFSERRFVAPDQKEGLLPAPRFKGYTISLNEEMKAKAGKLLRERK
ncbi:hypothetical protein FUAX_53200 (plasmid) [Fulvitalea axinellae]|uniref:Outer membrane lipoprotein-sorting protein n=1 Tax=Fulvitalea axinellae TaxID=1182444 RepID=A0AAU9CY71_9BACT|nr:hypothetical protein FUAX_53200 [Fulvitalea axinellae]